jgi:DNA-binding NtrC family response regulator
LQSGNISYVVPPELLFAWVGNADLRAAAGDAEAGLGPIASAAGARSYEEIVLLSSHPASLSRDYADWLSARAAGAVVSLRCEALTGPTEYREIHDAAQPAVRDAQERHGRGAGLTFHLSSGTPAMAAIWILLAKTRFPAGLIESSKARGVRVAEVPFEISAELLPALLSRADTELEQQAAGLPPPGPAFAAIVHRSLPMRRLLARVRRVALRSVPVLVEGESGTGKELVARAIHEGGPRAAGPFVAVNCGAIPEGLVESELFGHERGAFTGAVAARPGHFREAHGGTLFLDEVGELPLPAQVKLLRALQEKEVTAVGASRPTRVDVRVIAATHRSLLADVTAGRFRADLFYRLAVAVLRVPPLRERPGDLALLIDRIVEQVNAECAADPGYEPRRLTPAARNVLLAHGWPGNVRELANTIRRAALWSAAAAISGDDARDAILLDPRAPDGNVLTRPLDDGFSLPALLTEVARHYLERALAECDGNRSRAAALLGLGSHQTLANWLARHGVAPARARRT